MDEKVMESWDKWRKYISEGGTASWPRDDFENLIDWYEGRIKELEEKFPCGHRKIDWDNSYGNCVACQAKEMAEKYDDQLGFELRVKELEEGIEPLIKAQDNYIQLLIDEINELAGMAIVHGWKSIRYEEGKRHRELIANLKEKLKDLVEKK